MKKRSINIHGHQTSITLEDEFWHELKEKATQDGFSLNKLVSKIDDERSPETNLSSAIRLHILASLQEKLNASKD